MKICPQCGKEIILENYIKPGNPYWRHAFQFRKYCSDECEKAFNRSKIKMRKPWNLDDELFDEKFFKDTRLKND